MKSVRLFLLTMAVATSSLLGGCNATMSSLKQKASDNPIMTLAAGAAAAIVVVGTGGLALAVPVAVGGGVVGVYSLESDYKEQVNKMSCADAKELARRNYYGPSQRAELLGRACAKK